MNLLQVRFELSSNRFSARKTSNLKKKPILFQKNHRKHTNNKDINESVTSSTSTSDTDKNEDETRQTSSSEPDQNNNDKQPYEIANSKVMGRYLVSSRDLRAGEVVIKEKPIVIGPCGEPVCLGCYLPIPTRSNQYK